MLGIIWRKMPVRARRGVVKLTQPSFTASAASVIFNDDKQVLLLNHILRPASGWGIPGGFLNVGEQPLETARREALEETGLTVDNLKFLQMQTIEHHLEFWFVGTANGIAEAKSREILEAKWFDLTDLPPEMNRKERWMIEQAMQIREKSEK